MSDNVSSPGFDWTILLGANAEDEQYLPIFAKRIKEISIRIPGIEKDLTYKDVRTRNIKSFHLTDRPFKRVEQRMAQQVKSQIIATLMCLVVQEKMDKEGLQVVNNYKNLIHRMLHMKLNHNSCYISYLSDRRFCQLK